MKKLTTLACSLALTGACSGTPAVQGANNLVASPAKATAGTSAAPAGTPGSAEAPVATSGMAAGTASTRANRVAPAYRQVTLPSGTVLPVDLETAVGSETSRVEQPVSGRLRRAVSVGGVEALPAGTIVSGHVTAARRPGKVKGRGLIALRFTQVDPPGAGRTAMRTATISRLAPATKEQDALKIIAPAAAGAVIGRIADGKGGAAKGAVIGGGAGTGYVLATRGKDVHLARGTDLAVKLTAPLTLRVPVR